ncbi:MerR family transcriptional regulator [Actinorhabdospora filicis]|uniref:MerR family transcriptional regulator n=1 Tax=Actinorhabdospora filicis TaxID=1785913 RepID=A0A9W6SRC6_9ACTN|nr:MerR family transcriptional regulator [Actinorhabdospora filicis]GLZ80565.1 MerR family transcriptional regulator [Actinorhabdospora filicis]
MKIGDLVEATGVSHRLLRYYEEQGLLTPERSPGGHREYCEASVRTVRRIRALLAAGLPTAVIRDVLPCVTGEFDLDACTLDTLREHLSGIDQRLSELTEMRVAVSQIIDGIGIDGVRPVFASV